MATQIITRTLCDFCQADEVETTDDVETVLVAINGQRWEVDGCKPHRQPLLDLADTLAEHGRKVPMRAEIAPDGSARVECPACHKSYKNRASLGSHARQDHGLTLGQLEGRDTGKSFTCDECQREFDTPQGYAVHRNRAHGVKAQSQTS